MDHKTLTRSCCASMDGGTTWSAPKDGTEWTDWGGAQECM